MASWSGAHAITAGETGTATAATGTTLTNSGATWPTAGTGLTNYLIRILSGTGVGQERVISSNTATQVTVPAWSVTPDTSSTYEIVLKMLNGDTITSSFTQGNKVIAEIADNAVVDVTAGAVALTFSGTCLMRWNKSENTRPTLRVASRTSAGVYSSWTGVVINLSAGATCAFSWIKVMDVSSPLTVTPNSVTGTGSGIHHLWFENVNASGWATSGALDQNKLWQYIYVSGGNAGYFLFSSTASTFDEVFERFYVEKCLSAGATPGATGPANSLMRDSAVMCQSNRNISITTSTKTFSVIDSYIGNTEAADGAILMAAASSAANATYKCERNTIKSSRTLFGNVASSTATVISNFNDWIMDRHTAYRAIDNNSAANYTALTSDNDYISGTNGAIRDNIDTSASTSSSATPSQYINLTASRTNPKSVRNRLLTIDNVVVGTPTASQVGITYDCTNGAVSGQGYSTVDADSNSGQKVLNIADTTGFSVNGLVEIGYGTARSETGRIASISAGVSITLVDNLTYSHTGAQADVVKMRLRHLAYPYIKYGTASGVYTMSTPLPPQTALGQLFAEAITSWDGHSVGFNRVGHSLTIPNLKAGTTYYYQPFAVTIQGEVLSGSEGTFTTAAASTGTAAGNILFGESIVIEGVTTNGTYVPVSTGNVKTGVTFGAASAETGTCAVPAASDVRSGTAVNATTGTLAVPDPDDVLDGVATDNTTGTYETVLEEQVEEGIVFGPNGSLTGTLTGSADPQEIANAVFKKLLPFLVG